MKRLDRRAALLRACILPGHSQLQRVCEALEPRRLLTGNPPVIVLTESLSVTAFPNAINDTTVRPWLWKNPGEAEYALGTTPTDTNDADGDGKKDDVYGWNFVHDSPDIVNANPDNGGGHGASITSAAINALTSVGDLGADIRIMFAIGTEAHPPDHGGSIVVDGSQIVDYIIQKKEDAGVNIVAVSNSVGGGAQFSRADAQALQAHNILLFSPSGNNNIDQDDVLASSFYSPQSFYDATPRKDVEQPRRVGFRVTQIRLNLCAVFAVLPALAVSPTLAGITMSSFDTLAHANAYAPLDQSAYFATDDKPSSSPAVADVSADWTGTNVGGSINTWHMVASADISTVTTSTPTTLTATSTASFQYEIATTTGFVDPTRSKVLYAPGAAGTYECVFTLDSPANYALAVQLNQYSIVQFGSVASGDIVNQFNFTTNPTVVNLSGVVPPGQYYVRANASLGGPTPLNDGVNDVFRSGSYNSFSFTLQLPEPTSAPVVLISLTLCLWRHGSRTSHLPMQT